MLKSFLQYSEFRGFLMVKKLTKTDILFIIALLSGLLIHIFFLFSVPFSDDESFYALVPFRLISGESLIRNEWHLTQFSSLFAFLPVYIWTTIKGSADGIIIFLRCVYLLIHTSTAVVIYRFLRKHKSWAIISSMMFYVQIAYNIQAISYQSVLAISLLLMSLSLLSIYEKPSVKTYILAGICFGCCCICNPFLCTLFALYLFVCILWAKRDFFINASIKIKNHNKTEKGKKLTKKQKKQQAQQALDAFPDSENYNCYFNKNAILWITCGIVIIAIIAAAFFFLTGGTIASIPKNIENLLGSTEYDVVSKSIFEKLLDTLKYFSVANLGMPWIIPVLFIVVLLDKNRKRNTHRFVYLLIAVIWAFLFVFGIIKNMEIYVCGFSLPFFVISALIYMLTENKNKVLFNCMYVPTLIVTVFHYLAADTHLAAIGVVLAIANVAGVLFAKDLWNEMRTSSTEVATKGGNLVRSVIVIGICAQMLFYGTFYYLFNQYGISIKSDTFKATEGPYMGLYMPETEYNKYNKWIDDLDYIKSITNEKDPVLLTTYQNWMYLYLDRTVATYSAWYRGTINQQQLTDYYKRNPSRIPKYIYTITTYFNIIDEMFEYEIEELSNGYLLTVKSCKF